jgi:RimJ/RimL family protein N-acetyltransferase
MNLTPMNCNLIPFLIDEDQSKPIYQNEDCRRIFESYPAYYYKVGYEPPWIGYFLMTDGQVVGVAGFVTKPIDKRVEIAYGTFKQFENRGIAKFSCRELIKIARAADPGLTITAKTEPRENASTNILRSNGFDFSGKVQDDGIGDAWEWILTPMI